MERDPRRLAVVEQVTCLACSFLYGKPTNGGTLSENPGCPQCGYVGWMAVRRDRRPSEALQRLRETG